MKPKKVARVAPSIHTTENFLRPSGSSRQLGGRAARGYLDSLDHSLIHPFNLKFILTFILSSIDPFIHSFLHPSFISFILSYFTFIILYFILSFILSSFPSIILYFIHSCILFLILLFFDSLILSCIPSFILYFINIFFKTMLCNMIHKNKIKKCLLLCCI